MISKAGTRRGNSTETLRQALDHTGALAGALIEAAGPGVRDLEPVQMMLSQEACYGPSSG